VLKIVKLLMTDQNYFKIVRCTDEILTSANVSSVRVAIPWLHVIREHPIFLKNYKILFEERIIELYHIILRIIRNRLSVIAVLLRSLLQSESEKWLLAVKQLTEKDVIFVSHLLNHSQNEEEADFYFSDLPKKLRDNGFSSMVSMINHVRWSSFGDLNAQNKNQLYKLVFPRTLTFSEEIKNLKLLWLEHKRLKKGSNLEGNKLKKKVLFFAASEALSASSLSSLRLATQIKELVKNTRPKILISTHEGHSWERLIYSAARLATPNIKCIGYTHAPLFKNQHAVKRSLAKQYNPDMIFTSGKFQKKQLGEEDLLGEIPIHVLGSSRSLGKSAKASVLQNKKSGNSRKAFTCLVIPEGIESEIEKLFEFSLQCSLKFPDITFIWRLHPLFSFKKLSSRNSIYKNIPKNIVLSENELKNDFDSSQWVLYRGSSVVIQAVVAGLKPIYLNFVGEMDIDPLYEINNWKNEVETVQELESTIMQTNVDNYNYDDYHEVQEYCLDMYTPLDYGLLIDNLRKMNSNE
jgi:hypothetical protein